MTLLSDRGRAFRGSQVSSRSALSPSGLSGKMILWLLFLFSAGFIAFAQENIVVLDDAKKLLEGIPQLIQDVKSAKTEMAKYILPKDVKKYKVKLEKKVDKVKSSAENLDQIVKSLEQTNLKSSPLLNSAVKKLLKALTDFGGSIHVLSFREYIHDFSKLGDEWERIQGNLTDEAKKEAFKEELDKVDFKDFARRLEAYESVVASVHMDFEESALHFANFTRDLEEFSDKFNALRASLNKLKGELPESSDGSDDGPVDLSWYHKKVGVKPGGRSWYTKKRWWITGLVLTAAALGATYELSPDFREWVNSKFISSDSNQVATTSTFGSNLSSTTTLAPESNDSNALVWIITGVVLLALAGAAFYFFWYDRKQTSTDNVPKAAVDKSGAESKKGNSAATSTTPASTSSATSGGTSGAQVNSK